MLTELSIENFKSFKNKQQIKIKPLTIICGENSSGKSSILQSILMFKQFCKQKSEIGLSFAGPFLFGNSINDFLYKSFSQKAKSKIASFSFEINHDTSWIVSLVSKKGNESDFTTIDEYSIAKSGGKTIVFTLQDDNTYNVSPNDALTPIMNMFPIENKDIKIGLSKLTPTLQMGNAGEIPILPFLKMEELTSKKEASMHKYPLMVEGTFENIHYLGPVRAMPRLAYLLYDTSSHLDYDGGNVAQVIHLMQKNNVSFGKRKIPFLQAIDEAFTILGIHHSIKVKRENSIYFLNMTLGEQTEDEVPIANVGFGISQVLPVIVNGLLTPKGSIAIFEQPEIHLHPTCKARLADLFLKFIDDGKQILVETHSTELIDALRLKIIENPKLKEKINIIFVSQDNLDEGASIKTIEIDENGLPIEWPKGFCDTTADLAYKMVLERNRKKAMRK